METHSYAIECFTRDGRRVGAVAVAPDFQPAREWARFEAARRGLAPLVTAAAGGRVTPLWHDEHGAPWVGGVRIAADGSDAVCVELPAAFFDDLAAVVIAAHRRRGALGEDEETCWRVRALAAADEAEKGATQIEVTAAALPLPVAESALDDFVARSTPFGDASALDAPVFVASCVLDEALALAAEADALETGGVLVGRLHRDRGAPELFVEITAQIPARHATARQASFEFTPETWAAAHAAIELRAQDELILGWWHSHPNFCARCPAERWPTCTVARPFFSGEDAHLHRTCFPQAYQQALLVSDLPERRHTAAWFGWRAGEVAVRGFRVLAGEGRSR